MDGGDQAYDLTLARRERRGGAGRVAFFGEAAMFTAQIIGEGGRMGMNNPRATQNEQFLLNVMHWLTGMLN